MNLAFGFTDAPLPKHITNALADSATNVNHFLNQYTRDSVSGKLTQKKETIALSQIFLFDTLILIGMSEKFSNVHGIFDKYR